jgi:hypothetical protein
MFNITMGYEKQIEKNCRLLVGTMLSGNPSDANSISIFVGYYYGVRLMIGSQSKI